VARSLSRRHGWPELERSTYTGILAYDVFESTRKKIEITCNAWPASKTVDMATIASEMR